MPRPLEFRGCNFGFGILRQANKAAPFGWAGRVAAEGSEMWRRDGPGMPGPYKSRCRVEMTVGHLPDGHGSARAAGTVISLRTSVDAVLESGGAGATRMKPHPGLFPSIL